MSKARNDGVGHGGGRGGRCRFGHGGHGHEHNKEGGNEAAFNGAFGKSNSGENDVQRSLVGVIHMLTILVDHAVVDNMVVSAMVRMEMLNAHPQGSLSDIVVLGVGMKPNVMDLDMGTEEHPLMKLYR